MQEKGRERGKEETHDGWIEWKTGTTNAQFVSIPLTVKVKHIAHAKA